MHSPSGNGGLGHLMNGVRAGKNVAQWIDYNYSHFLSFTFYLLLRQAVGIRCPLPAKCRFQEGSWNRSSSI